MPTQAAPRAIVADITTLDVDAIVNAANERLAMGGGLCGAIFRRAGERELAAACTPLAPCPTGQAVITPGFRLKARFVIHAVGPVWHGREERLLRSAYESCFALARQEPSIRTIAFPAISTGIYGYPKDRAARIAVQVMKSHESAFDRIVACVFDEESRGLYEREVGKA